MTFVGEIGERVAQGVPWTLTFENGRGDSGYAATFVEAADAVARALIDERVAQDVFNHYDRARVEHRDSGD